MALSANQNEAERISANQRAILEHHFECQFGYTLTLALTFSKDPHTTFVRNRISIKLLNYPQYKLFIHRVLRT